MGRRWVCPVTAISTDRSLAGLYIYVRESTMQRSMVFSGRPAVSMCWVHDGVCARRMGNVLDGLFQEAFLRGYWYEIRQGFEGVLCILEVCAL
jgi:hypothetical protein